MKRILLIGALVLVALLVVSVPAGIGWLIQNQARPALEQRLPGAAIEWRRGWFRSGVSIDDPDLDADIDFRHLTGSPPGWLAIDGRVLLADPATAIDLNGHVSLGLDGELDATAPQLRHGDRVRWQHENPALAIAARDDALRINASADTLRIDDPLGNRLVLANPDAGVGVEESRVRKLAVALTLEGSRAGRQTSRAVVRMDGVDPNALQQLVQGIGQLVSGGTDGAVGGLAAIGLASAWQQLVEGGVALTLEELTLDGSLELAGRWTPAEESFSLDGGGDRDALLAWWSTLAGLIRGVPPAEARASAERTLADFIDRDLIAVDGDRLRVSLQSLPQTAGR